MTNRNQTENSSLKAEFDSLADDYHAQHAENIAITGEGPEYFAEYKIADLAELAKELDETPQNVLDFGCGIGNSVPYFRKYFPDQAITCADVSARSIEIAQTRFPGEEKYAQVDLESKQIPLGDATQDITFSACVFHHIPHEEHAHWLGELRRVTRPGGMLVIYEHNPLNPLTIRAVNTCPLDVNAKLISGSTMNSRARANGWTQSRIDYRLFFPAVLSRLRPLEKALRWLALGAQYRLVARKRI